MFYQNLNDYGYISPYKNNCGCGCNGNGCNDKVNVIGESYNNRIKQHMNGTFDDIFSSFSGVIGGEKPLASIDISLTNDSLLKVGLVGVGLIILNKQINSK